MFCSRSIATHLLKGIGAIALISLIFYINTIQLPYAMLLSPLLLIGAFVLLRGCPMCWLMGLFQTIANRKDKLKTDVSSH